MVIKQSTPPKIITITLNTAIDNFIELENLEVGGNLLAVSSREFASGKGVNVAKAIECLGCQVNTLGFVGRQSQNLFAALKSELLLTDFLLVVGKTRTNITLYDAQQQTETHVRTSGYSVTAADCDKLIDILAAQLCAGDIVIISGSLPSGAAPEWYQSLIETCHNKTATPILDTQGAGLSQGLKAGPYLIKPNQHEFAELVGQTLNNEDEIIGAARTLINGGPLLVFVSRGEHGALLVSADRAIVATVDSQTYAEPLSTIGCGDALLAGFAVARLQGYELVDAVLMGVACGTANMYTVEPGRFAAERFDHLKARIKVRTLRC